MKSTILFIVLVTIVATYSCKKQTKLPPPENVVVQMKADPEFKDLFNGVYQYTRNVLDGIPRDTVAIKNYMESNKASAKLQQLAGKLKERYHLGKYGAIQAEGMVRDAFKALYLTRNEPLGTAIDDDPQKFPANKKCWQRLIDDVSDCDEEVVVRSGLSLFGLLSSFGTYVISQATAFYQHSKCVDRAQRDYKRCLIDAKLNSALDPEDPMIDTSLVVEELYIDE